MNPFNSMNKFLIPILGALAWPCLATAQEDIPLLRPEEQAAVDAQSDEFNNSLSPALANAANSTVRIWAGNYRLAYGTVVGDGGQILSKWSEIARAPDNLRAQAAGGEIRQLTVTGVYQDEDLALLAVNGSPLTPVKWSEEQPKLGSFLAAPQPDGRPAGFGVVSVLERNLRDTDQAFLGIVSDPEFDGTGVRIVEIAPDTGAAAAGLKPGNIIEKIDDRAISGLLELKNALVGVEPGATITLDVKAGRNSKKIDVVLGNRPNLPNYLGDRLRQMEAMGTRQSRVRDSFTRAMQTDMRMSPDQIGGPVVNLQGRVVGITIARADRTRSFVMPASAVESLLLTEPGNPALAQVRPARRAPEMQVRQKAAPRRFQPGDRKSVV